MLTRKSLPSFLFLTPALHLHLECRACACAGMQKTIRKSIEQELNDKTGSDADDNYDDDVLSTKFEQYVARVILDFAECRRNK